MGWDCVWRDEAHWPFGLPTLGWARPQSFPINNSAWGQRSSSRAEAVEQQAREGLHMSRIETQTKRWAFQDNRQSKRFLASRMITSFYLSCRRVVQISYRFYLIYRISRNDRKVDYPVFSLFSTPERLPFFFQNKKMRFSVFFFFFFFLF